MDNILKQKAQELHPTLNYSNATLETNKKTYRKIISNIKCNVCLSTFSLPNLSKHINHPFQGCKECSKRKQTERKKGAKIDIFTLLSNKHPEYIFCLEDNITTKDKVNTYCKLHGHFSTTVDSLLYKNTKCPTCSKELSGFNKSIFKNRCKDQGILYIIEIKSDTEHFYKVGITSNSIKERYSNFPYEYNIIRQVTGNPELIWELEYSCKRLIKETYEPIKAFNGSKTETFMLQDLNSILDTIDNCKNTYQTKVKHNKTYLESFIERVEPRHETKYDYSKCIWVDKNTKLEIICPVHGSFFQLPKNHLQGYGCPSCGKLKAIRRKKQSEDG